MLVQFILFLPAFTCLFCLLQSLISSRRPGSDLPFQLLLTAGFICAFSESFHDSGYASLVEAVSGTCIVPLAGVYLRGSFSSKELIWLVIPVLFLVFGVLLLLLGDDASHFYYLLTVVAFRVIMIISAAAALCHIAWYLHKNPRESHLYGFIPLLIIIIVKASLNDVFVSQNVWISLVLATLLALCILNIYYIYMHNAAPAEVEEVLGLDEDNSPENTPEAELPASSAQSHELFATLAGTWDENNLLSRFQKLVVKDRLFLQPGISVVEIAEKLHTNKTYVSKLVNNTYKMGFPELINELRIDYAEHYIMNHRGAKQEEIAEACGFPNSSSFNSIFKKVKGVTPRTWLSTTSNKDHNENT